MLARLRSFILHGIDALPCEVEVDLNDAGERKEMVVGLPDVGVKEALERVRTVLANTGAAPTTGRLLVNLAPADIRKEGPVYDLPIALGILLAQGVLPPPHASGIDHRRYVIAGELALDGRLRPVRGAIALAAMAKSMGAEGVILPASNADEAAVVEGLRVLGVESLQNLIEMIRGQRPVNPRVAPNIAQQLQTASAQVDFAQVRGQEGVKRAIVVAAAGSHNILMLGPAGTGKTMMARALPGVLPPLTGDEAVEVTRIYSAAGITPQGGGLVTTRPVRTPHHTASPAALVGGGVIPRPGEISLAHHGVLFLDEFPEFPRPVLEALRQPLEDRTITIARSHGAVKFPARFMLVAAMNPTRQGSRGPGEIGQREMDRYLSKLSGPLLDRIDIHVEAPAVAWRELNAPAGTSSSQMREQVLAARAIQTTRQGAATPNAYLSGQNLDKLAPLDDAARTLLGQAMTELRLSARAYDKVRRLSRTIADLAGAETIGPEHVAEAVQYRLLDRQV